MLVEDLIKHLLKCDQKSKVVVLDHFGKEIELTEGDFNYWEYRGGDLPSGVVGHRVVVTAVDIGPEPE